MLTHHRSPVFSSRISHHRHTRLVRCHRSARVSASAQPVEDQPPAGCSRYTVSLRKPLGLVLEQDPKTMNIYVVEILPTGSAARNPNITVGDQLIATTGVTYSRVDDYGGAKVQNGQQVVRLRVLGETFKTVSAAIGSHPGHMEVTMEFQKCDPVKK